MDRTGVAQAATRQERPGRSPGPPVPDFYAPLRAERGAALDAAAEAVARETAKLEALMSTTARGSRVVRLSKPRPTATRKAS